MEEFRQQQDIALVEQRMLPCNILQQSKPLYHRAILIHLSGIPDKLQIPLQHIKPSVSVTRSKSAD
jgi:hypothetical protein